MQALDTNEDEEYDINPEKISLFLSKSKGHNREQNIALHSSAQLKNNTKHKSPPGLNSVATI